METAIISHCARAARSPCQHALRLPHQVSRQARQLSARASFIARPRHAPHSIAPQNTAPQNTVFAPSTLQHVRQRRAARPFTSTASPSAKAIVNPRQDEQGQDMVIEITPRASERLHKISSNDANPSLCLRVSVESGGCHGFQYLMSLSTTDDVTDEDTLFQSEDGKESKVVMDEPSLELLKGSKIDYTMELIGSQFKVTGIPGAKSSCGCGTSFDIQS